MKIIIKVTIIIFLIKLFASCTMQNEEEYFGEPVCDSLTVNRDDLVVYYEDLTYVFTGICLPCHNSQLTYRPGILMDSYEDVVKSVETGKVLPAIKHDGYYKMPYNQAKLSDCEIQKIAKWIENGMPKKSN